MPRYVHSCFISYKHPPVYDNADTSRHFWMEFITTFQAKLGAFMTLGLPMYRDDQLQSVPGAGYPTVLSQNLCRSVCMIAILVPEYMESSWCQGEWKAMEKLERERAADPGIGGSIIPILFRGDKAKAAEFCGPRVLLDFRHIAKPSIQLNTIDSRVRIEDIARRIAQLANYPSPTDCSTFNIAVGAEVVDPGHDDPDPLA
jgi:hypothetical protein